MQKNMKTAIPAVKVHPSIVRSAPPPRPEDDGDDGSCTYVYDDDEWDDEDVYDNDAEQLPTRGPPPPIPPSRTPNDGDSDEDYEKPKNPGPTGRAPLPHPNDDDEDWYLKPNQKKIPGRIIPPPRNYLAPQQRSVPTVPSKEPSVPPPRGGCTPIAPPSSRPILYEVSPLPPRRNSSSPPPPISRPSGPAGSKSQEIYEDPDENEALAVPEYESVEDSKAIMVHVHVQPPQPPPSRTGRRELPPTPAPDPNDGQLNKVADDIPQMNDGCDEPRPPKPEKIQIAEINSLGAPEPPKRRQEPPGPPGGPPEAFASHALLASPVADTSDIKKQPWYFGDCGRDTANKILLESAKEGTYLVRDSKGSGQPYTLGIFYKGNTSNIVIRKRPDGKFALGTDKPDEHVFETINDMITFHRCNDIEVFKSGILAGRVKLVKVAEKSIYLSTSPRF